MSDKSWYTMQFTFEADMRDIHDMVQDEQEFYNKLSEFLTLKMEKKETRITNVFLVQGDARNFKFPDDIP